MEKKMINPNSTNNSSISLSARSDKDDLSWRYDFPSTFNKIELLVIPWLQVLKEVQTINIKTNIILNTVNLNTFGVKIMLQIVTFVFNNRKLIKKTCNNVEIIVKTEKQKKLIERCISMVPHLVDYKIRVK